MAKRGNGEGCWKKRSDGRQELAIMVGYHPDGRRKIKSSFTSLSHTMEPKR